MSYDLEKIRKSVVEAGKELGLSPEESKDLAFHMTDWLQDFYQWQQFCEGPQEVSSEELSKLLISFLLHVPAHLAAAGKIATGEPVTDVFGIGAVQ